MNCRVRSPNAPFKGLIGDQALRNFSEVPRPQGGALKPKFLKPTTEIPKQVRDDKNENQTPLSELVSASGSVFFLPLADTPFIPVHRTGFSGVILINFDIFIFVIHLKFGFWHLNLMYLQ